MPNSQRGATNATMWQDNHSGYRGHRLKTTDLGKTIPALGTNDDVEDYDYVFAPAKLFSPYNGWTWCITEWDPETGLCFGLVTGFETELGYFDLTELGGGHGAWQCARSGARPPLGARDYRGDKGTVALRLDHGRKKVA